ncbi:serine/threonine-protein kinase [bacterium]|nr:serine/threonine-protein kinase [bacterium]
MIGKTISHYKIFDKLGEGGMGVVYKAEDTKLKREVALKFLPANALQGKEEKDRFTREAQAAAALSHPNIATVFAIDEVDSQTFLAMELIDGQDLVGAIRESPLPIDRSIDYATQIAAGLQAAHEKGIVHRDIKSANIMINDKAVVKIMDFGLAKLADRSKMTQLGTTLGTAAYMSPEQARGDEADHRSDIWSLGVVLYEMISGQLPFKGDYEQAVTYSILNEDPEPLTALRTGVPMEIERIVTKCLMKDAALRYQHTEEIAVDLKTANLTSSRISGMSTISQITTAGQALQPEHKRTVEWKKITPMLVLAMVVGAAAVWTFNPQPSPAPRLVKRFVADVSPAKQVRTGSGNNIAFSNDGKHLAYVASDGEVWQLYLRSLDVERARALPGTEDAFHPFFSPDDQWIGFYTSQGLKKILVAGGNPITIKEQPGIRGATWGFDGSIILGIAAGGLLRVSASGESESLTTPDRLKDELSHRWPQILPGGKSVLFTVRKTAVGLENDRLALLSLETKEYHTLQDQGGTNARYSPTEHIIYAQQSMLMAVPFHPQSTHIERSPLPIIQELRTVSSGAATFAFSKDGTFVYLSGLAITSDRMLMWVDRQGKTTALSVEPADYGHPRLSPNGQLVAVDMGPGSGNADIWIYNVESGRRIRLTFDEGGVHPVWTPDGKRVAFNRQQGDGTISWKRADGSGDTEQLVKNQHPVNAISWSPDGQILAMEENHLESGMNILTFSLKERRTQPFLVTPYNERSPMFSPDGKWIAYVSDESGQKEIYVQPFPGPGSRWPISTEGGQEPVWSVDGKELFFRNGDKMMVVAIEYRREFKASTPRQLFEGRFVSDGGGHPRYDVSSDGKRFIMTRIVEETSSSDLRIVVNWFEELKRLVPNDR